MAGYTDIIFVRHGETDGNNAGILQGRGNSHLSPNGRLQAAAAAEVLKEENFTLACSSDLIRAVETTEILLKYHPGVPLETSPDLEELNCGIYEGRLQSELQQEIPELLRACCCEYGDYEMPGGESRREFQARISRCIDALLERTGEGSLLLVSHGWAAHRILAHFYGPPKTGMLLSTPNNTGISRFRYYRKEKRFLMITWNSVDHLRGLPVHRNPVDC